MPLNQDTDGTVSAFRGLRQDFKRGSARASFGMPASAATMNSSFLKKLEKLNPDALNCISQIWDSCLPQKFRNKSHPKSIKTSTLYVETVNSTVKQELTFLEKSILSKLSKSQTSSDIKKIKFI